MYEVLERAHRVCCRKSCRLVNPAGRRPEALHCAIPGTYIASTHSQSNARILELFFHDNVTYQWLLTWLQRPAKMYLPNICRIRKNCFKTDELWGARHAATIALARYYVQVNGAAELVAHARRTLVLNRLFNGRTKCSPSKASKIANFSKLLLTSKQKVRRN